MQHKKEVPPFEWIDFDQMQSVPCPCGMAKRALLDVEDFPGSLHVTQITKDAVTHYHKRITEVYYILECHPEAKMELQGETYPLKPGACIMIRPGTRHRAIGEMRVLILAIPKFDPNDEWFDEPALGHDQLP